MNNTETDSIDLSTIFSFLKSNWKLVALITFVGALTSVFYAVSQPNYYKSSALVVPNSSEETSALQSQFGSIASLAGVKIPSSSGNKTQLIISTLSSREFLQRLLNDENILPNLLAVQEFDHQNQKVIFRNDEYNAQSKTWIREVSYPYKKIPSLLEAHEAYLEIFNIQHDKLTDFITISVEHKSPIFTKFFLELIIKELNESLREEAQQEAQLAISFLENEMSKAKLKSIQEALSFLSESQIKNKMLADIRSNYAVKVIDAPFIPLKKSKPKRAIICILGTIFSFLLSLLIIFIIKLYKDIKD